MDPSGFIKFYWLLYQKHSIHASIQVELNNSKTTLDIGS
jgi:hypothetical protein